MAVKALTFDIIGTVFDWLQSFSANVGPLAHKYGLGIDPAGFAHQAVAGYGSGVLSVLNGGPWVPPDEILRDSITSLLSAAGAHPPAAAEVDDFFALWRTLDPWPDAPAALYALHDHYTLAILSNMSIPTQSALTDHAGLPFDRTLSAETVHTYKPRPAVYQMAISALGLPPDEIMMVAAHPYDLTAAQEQGMRTAYIARPSEPAAAAIPAFDVEASTYGELSGKLGAAPPTLKEDCLRIRPHQVQVRHRPAGWTVVDGSHLLMDFGVSQADAERAKEVIAFYALDRICYVGRPNPPMTYFTVKGSAPAGPMPAEDAIRFDLARVGAERSAGDWIVTDGVSRLLDFGQSRVNALHAVAIIRHYGFTHQCFVGRPHEPMMYFRK